MSVRVSERTESKFEVMTYSIEVHNLLIEAMQKNFGIKDLNDFVRTRYRFGKDRAEERAKHNHLMHNFKFRIDQIASFLTSNIRSANSIYPTAMHEYEQRREYQNRAIANCEQLIKELQQVVEVFNVDINTLHRPMKAIDREIGLIKKWRQQDNRIKSYFQGNV